MPYCDILLATDVRFWRSQLGNETRIAHMLEWFQGESLKVTVFFVGALAREDRALISKRFGSIRIIWADGECGVVPTLSWLERLSLENLARSLLWRTHKLFRKLLAKEIIPTLDAYFRPNVRRSVEVLLGTLKPKLFIVEYVHLAYLLPTRPQSDCHSLIDTHDIQSERFKVFRTNGETAWLSISAIRERRALYRADHILAIQSEEAQFLRENWNIPSVHLVPHASTLVSIPWNPTGQVLFVGSAAKPNVLAMLELLELWPALCARTHRMIELHIVGSVASRISGSSSLEGVYIHGVVDELRPFYAQSELVVNPVRFGSGLKIKCVEALCYGRPVLTTPTGAQGFDVTMDTGLVVSSTGAAFVDSLADLLNSPDALRVLSGHAIRYARNHFSPDAAYAPLKRLLVDVQTSRDNLHGAR